MQDCWQKSTAAGFIREEMIAAIESDTGKTCNLSLSVASDNKPSLKILLLYGKRSEYLKSTVLFYVKISQNLLKS